MDLDFILYGFGFGLGFRKFYGYGFGLGFEFIWIWIWTLDMDLEMFGLGHGFGSAFVNFHQMRQVHNQGDAGSILGQHNCIGWASHLKIQLLTIKYSLLSIYAPISTIVHFGTN